MNLDEFNLPYNFLNYEKSDIRSLIHAINLLGENLIGLELGVFQAESFMTILHNCPNVKKLYGVDSYQPYKDYLKDPYDGIPSYTVDRKSIELIKSISFNRIKYSGMKEKVQFFEEDSDVVADKIQNNYLDFIFIDTYMTYEQAKKDIEIWYPKVKRGGLFSGHDWNSIIIQKALIEYKKEKNIDKKISHYDNCWCWIK